MLNNKKAQSLGKRVESGVIIILVVVILFLVYAELVPEAQTAGDKLNLSNRCEAVGCVYNTTTASISGSEVDCANNLSPERVGCQNALGEGIPLSGLFRGKGIVMLLIMVALVITLIKTVMGKSKK